MNIRKKHSNKPINNFGMYKKVNGKKTRIANFKARIKEEIEVYENGQIIDRRYVVVAQIEGQKPITFDLCDYEFNKIDWVRIKLGVEATIYIERNQVSIIFDAIRCLSSKRKKSIIYSRLGFVRHNNVSIFVHGNGAILPKEFEVDSKICGVNNDHFELFGFPNNKDSTIDIKKNIVEVLQYFDLSINNKGLGIFLGATAFRAPISIFRKGGLAIYLVGDTGTFKSSIIGTLQSFFAPGTTEQSLPLRLTSTPTGMELAIQQANGHVIVIDEYIPNSQKNNVDNDFIERIIMQAGTSIKRARGKSATELEKSDTMQSAIAITSEIVLEHDWDSRHARITYCDVGRGDIDSNRLLQIQQLAEKGVYAYVMKEYIQFIVNNYGKLELNIPKKFNYYRSKAKKELPGLHLRLLSNIADIILGVYYFLQFAKVKGAISDDKKNRLLKTYWDELKILYSRQSEIAIAYSTAGIIQRRITEVIRRGLFHVQSISNKTDQRDIKSQQFGWSNNKPQGVCLGYADFEKNVLYIHRAFNINQLLDALPKQISKILPTSNITFWKKMHKLGLLSKSQDDRNTTTIRIGSGIDSESITVYPLKMPYLFA